MTDILGRLTSDEQTFYAIGNKAWKECLNNQEDFVAFNGIYTPDYIDQAVKDLQAAQALPNYDMRQAAQRSARVNVDGMVAACNVLVQQLYTIIGRAFAAGQVDAMRQAAGSSYYASAASGNLNSANTLYSMVSSFLITYNDDLLSGNMPATFADSFSDAQTRFTKAFVGFTNAKDNAAKGGVAKNAANAAVCATLMSMLADGKAIYMQNPVKRKSFSYRELKRMVAGVGKTGIRFTLTQAVTQLPVANAVIQMQPGNYTLYPNKKGIVVELLASDTYTYTITAPGMKTVEGSIKVKAGGVRRVKVVFAAAEVVAAAEVAPAGEAAVRVS